LSYEGFGVLWSQDLLLKLKGLLVEGLGLAIAVLGLIQGGQVVEA
jgi:hypothetical protein